MKSKNIRKIVLSLFIALAFIMPISALGNEVEVRSSRPYSGYEFKMMPQHNMQSPLQNSEVCIIDLLNFTDPMATGCYEFDVVLEKINLNIQQNFPCDVKLFLDIWKEDDIVGDEIYCTDFEDPGDIYNHWEACDGPSGDGSSPDCAIDTWAWSDARSHSPGHSMHSSQFDTYMGNQNDFLYVYLPLDKDYDELKLVFWHWMEGERIEVNDSGAVTYSLEDWGMVQYSYDFVTWTDLSEKYYDNSTWDEIVLWITDSSGEDDIWIRWYWHTGPVCQYEGWYIDDVCLYGYEGAGWGTRVFDTYTPHAITIDADLGIMTYKFDEEYCFDEGNYSIRIWAISETEECEVCNPQNDPFWFNFTVKDIYDIAVTANSFTITNQECDGGDLTVTGEVCNVGTLDAYDVQVTMTIQEQISQTVFESFVEEDDFSDWYYMWTGYLSSDLDWTVTDTDSYSPTHSWTTVNGTTGQARQQSGGMMTPEIYPYDGDPIAFDFQTKLKYQLEDHQDIAPAFVCDAYYWPLRITGAQGNPLHPAYGNPAFRDHAIQGPNASGWHTFSYSEWINTHWDYYEERYDTAVQGFKGYVDLLNSKFGPDGLDIEDFTMMHIGYKFHADVSGSGSLSYTGLYADDYKFTKVFAGAERYSETIIIPELPVGECEIVEFVWENMPTGNFVETKCVPPDDNDENNCMSGTFEIWSEIDCADEEEMESQDLTTAAENHWHVEGSGYDNYIYCGLPEICSYNNSWNDPLCITREGNATIDMSLASEFTVDYWDWFEGEFGNDYGVIEINPAVSQPDSTWYTYDPYNSLALTAWFEDFEAAPPYGVPAGWTTNDLGTSGGTWEAYFAGDLANDFLFFSPRYMAADSDWYGPGFASDLWSAPIDMTINPGMQYVTYTSLSRTIDSDEYYLEIYSDMTNGPFYEATVRDFMLTGSGYFLFYEDHWINPMGFNDPTDVYLRWVYDDNDVWAWNVAFDDVFLGFSDPGFSAESDHGWQHNILTFDESVHMVDFFNLKSGDTFANEVGTDFTNDMGIRFRFISDEDVVKRGWMINNFTLLVDSDVIIDNDPCDDMTNLVPCGIVGGDWWYYDDTDPNNPMWCNEDQVSALIPNDVDNALVWDTSVPQAMAAILSFEHDFDIDAGDYVYLEFSTDGGNNWLSPVRYTGSTPGWTPEEIDMSSFTGDNVLIRWRVDTNATDVSTIYCLRNICIKAQVDTVAPITIGTISGTMIYGWYSSPVTFTATASDDVSGVAATYYKIDGGSTLTYSAPITISVNGEHQIEYWSVDNVGNEEIHKFTPTFRIDTGDAPSVAITAPGDGLYLFGNQLLSLSGRTIIIGGFTVQATASDDDSGVYAVTFALDGTVFGEDASSPYSAYCGEKHTGAGTITVTAEDFTGNSASASKDITYFKFL